MKNLKNIKSNRSGNFHRPILIAALLLFPNLAAACGYGNNQSVGQSLGFRVYVGLITLRGTNTGQELPAYQGFGSGSLENCINSCLGKSHCKGVTFRPQVANSCLKFGTINFVTKEPMTSTLIGGWTGYRSVLVRSGGQLCN